MSDSKQQEASPLALDPELFRVLAECIPHMVWSARADGYTDYYNGRVLEYLGKKPGDLDGWTWPSALHPDDVEPSIKASLESIASGTDYCREHRVRRACDGQYRWHVTHVVPLRDANGCVVRWFGTATDIHDRRSAEEALRESEWRNKTISELMTDYVFVVDVVPSGLLKLRWASESMQRITGRTVEDAATSDMWSSIIHPDDIERFFTFAQKIVVTGESGTIECRTFTKQGQERHTRIIVQPQRDARGAVTTIVGAVQDITERRRAEEEREHLQAQLQQAQKMEAVGRLSGGIAHDFNNLLTVIQGNTEIISLLFQAGVTERTMEKATAALGEIGQAAERAANLTSQLLTFSRKHVAHVHVLDMNVVVYDLEKMLRRLVREDITLEIACNPGEHLILADKTQMEQVLINLSLNASDAMPNGGRLTIEVIHATLSESHARKHADAGTGPHVVITVTDTGIGMDANTLDHLFEPFFTTKPYGRGAGLGLSIVYGIVKNSGGHITVKSKPGKGSTFKVYIPVAQGETSRPTETPTPRWLYGDETILLCEDEPLVRRLTASILRQGGYTVIEAETGEQAVRLAAERASTFQLLITDVVMPGMKGDKAAAAILKSQPDVQVLFISGYAPDVLSDGSMTEDEMEFLQKPFKPDVLLRQVREMLNRANKRNTDSRPGGRV